MPTATKTKPSKREFTKLRGPELARHVLTIIEAEDEREKALLDDRPFADAQHSGNIWNQGSWFDLDHKHLPEDAKVKVVGKSSYSVQVALEPHITCGTAMCFAGWAASEVGDRFLVNLYPDDDSKVDKVKKGSNRLFRKIFKSLNNDTSVSVSTNDMVLLRNGHKAEISARAQKLLGLSDRDAGVLFEGSNSIDTLRFYVELLERHGKIFGTEEHKDYAPWFYDR